MPPIPFLMALAAAGTGLFYAMQSSMPDAAAAVWLWGAAIFAPYYLAHGTFGPSYRMPSCKASAIAFIAASALLSYAGKYNLSLTCLFLAPMLYFGNFKILAVSVVPVFIWTAVVPQTEYFHHLISYPMRIVGAEISAFILGLFGFSAEASQTIVTIGGKDIAVTAACSGVEQLEAMLLAGWIIAAYMHSGTWTRIAHFASILPIILLVNSLRLVATLGGYDRFGDFFISDEVHVALGMVSVILIVSAFMAVGLAFPRDSKGAK